LLNFTPFFQKTVFQNAKFGVINKFYGAKNWSKKVKIGVKTIVETIGVKKEKFLL